jgi:hypothetical protein
MSGADVLSQTGVHGLTPGPIIYAYVGKYSGSRFACGYWIDNNNQFWMFGGEGFGSSGNNGTGLLSD